ncbi:MAG: MBL fold metallo-hydrolase [Candidatus Margulisbacteria bacterium]|nr:MBL fold metallo-hydrolase [Candidatus Margulisiibacteriota bacterium]
MKIKCYGSRGSVPVCGKEYKKYGGETTCFCINEGLAEQLVIDAGTGIRRLGNDLLHVETKIIHIFFTHVHWDHILGFPFFKPLYNSNYEIHIYSYPNNHKHNIQESINRTFMQPYFPINIDSIKAKVIYHDLSFTGEKIGNLQITPIPISHPDGGCGYKISEMGKTFILLTDNELGYQHPEGLTLKEYQNFCKDADLLVHDAEFRPEEYERHQKWGHSQFEDAVHLAQAANVKSLGLFHHNQDRNDEGIDRIVNESRKILSSTNIECFALHSGQDIEI